LQSGVNLLLSKVTRLLRCLVQLLDLAVNLDMFRSTTASPAQHLPRSVNFQHVSINFKRESINFYKKSRDFKMPRSTSGFSGQPGHVSINYRIPRSTFATLSQLSTWDDQLLT